MTDTLTTLRAARRDFRAAQRALTRHPGPLAWMAFLAAQDAMTAAHRAHMNASTGRTTS